MREILFRGFHECEDGDTTIVVDGREVRGRWVEGLPGYDINGRISEIQHFNSPAICDLFDIFPSTVGQYTGLTDKNGRKIFEHDIIKCMHKYQLGSIKTGTVYFEDFAWFGAGDYLDCCSRLTSMKVVGTIFDNAQEVAK